MRRELAGRTLIALLLVLAAAAAALVSAVLWPAQAPSFAQVRAGFEPSDGYLLDRHGVVIDSRRVRYDVRRLPWVALADVSPALVAAVVAGEDRRFWQHEGVDWASAAGALRDELLLDRRRGASTIAMQLAWLLEHRRTGHGVPGLLGKLRQVRLARALSRQWSRPQILEAYLNLLEYRGELQGIAAASAQLAGKTPAGLSLPESLVLGALLPQPQAGLEHVTARACARARELSPAPDCATLRATALSLLEGGQELPREHLAPPLAQGLIRHAGERVRTSLDAQLQRRAIDLVRARLESLADRNVRDAAAVVVDNASGEVLAYVGSGGPRSRAPRNDGVRAARQAGSTLKPFLYELALEKRYLTAGSLLDDAPLTVDTAGGLYIPQDYDHDFKGLVSVRTALAASLNVPAVRTLVLTGVEPFRERLHELGYAHIKEEGAFYGWSLALGSAEVTLWEQAQAYRTLALGGRGAPLTLSPAGGGMPAPRLSAEATFVVSDILADPAARAVTFGLDNHLHTAFWSAVKTGTSEDMRDNWCIGFSRHYTVAVWVGNFEGDSMHGVSGVTGAAPIWHDLMAVLEPDAASAPPPAPAGVAAVLTHFAPAVEPPRREWYLAGTELAGGSAAVPNESRPRIESPADGAVIALDPDIPPANQRVPVIVSGVRPGMRLMLNETELGPARGAQLWAPRPGHYRLRLEDAAGRGVSAVGFTVRGAGVTPAAERLAAQ